MSNPSDTVELSVIIPCYASGPWLADCVARIESTLSQQESVYEILLVNDASPDDTWATICQLAKEHESVRGLNLQFNCGQFRATLCGLSEARGAILVTMDDDLQHPPESLPELLAPLANDSELDCVLARFPSKKHSMLRNLGSRVVQAMNRRLYGAPANLTLSGFRAMRRGMAEAVCAHQTSNPVLGPLLLKSGRKFANVDVPHAERIAGQSGYGITKLIRITLANVLSASTLPLRLVSYLGIAASSMSLLLALSYLTRFMLFGRGVKGFTTQVLLMNFYGGLTLFAIGLVGEYLIRVIDEVRRPPRYYVRDRIEK